MNVQLSVLTVFRRGWLYSKCLMTQGFTAEASLETGSGERRLQFLSSRLSSPDEAAQRSRFSLVPVSSAPFFPSNLTVADPNVPSNPFQGISLWKAF